MAVRIQDYFIILLEKLKRGWTLQCNQLWQSLEEGCAFLQQRNQLWQSLEEWCSFLQKRNQSWQSLEEGCSFLQQHNQLWQSLEARFGGVIWHVLGLWGYWVANSKKNKRKKHNPPPGEMERKRLKKKKKKMKNVTATWRKSQSGTIQHKDDWDQTCILLHQCSNDASNK